MARSLFFGKPLKSQDVRSRKEGWIKILDDYEAELKYDHAIK